MLHTTAPKRMLKPHPWPTQGATHHTSQTRGQCGQLPAGVQLLQTEACRPQTQLHPPNPKTPHLRPQYTYKTHRTWLQARSGPSLLWCCCCCCCPSPPPTHTYPPPPPRPPDLPQSCATRIAVRSTTADNTTHNTTHPPFSARRVCNHHLRQAKLMQAYRRMSNA